MTVFSRKTLLLIAGLMIFFTDCSMWNDKKVRPLNRSDIVPAASGKLKVSTDDNNNEVVRVEVEGLAPPQNLSPPSQYYVVWVISKAGKAFPLGQIEVKEGQGKFRSTSPISDFRVVITGEQNEGPQEPSDRVVLSSNFIGAK